MCQCILCSAIASEYKKAHCIANHKLQGIQTASDIMLQSYKTILVYIVIQTIALTHSVTAQCHAAPCVSYSLVVM